MPLDLKPIEARLAAASEGPWQAEQEQLGARSKPVHIIWSKAHVVARCGSIGMPKAQEDTDLIAHAPTDLAALIQEVERLRAAIRATYTAPDPMAFFAAERALQEIAQGASPASLPDLIRQAESRGWRWESGHSQGPFEPGRRFYARLWLPSLDPMHDEEPWADERIGWGETLEEATRAAWSLLPPDPYKK